MFALMYAYGFAGCAVFIAIGITDARNVRVYEGKERATISPGLLPMYCGFLVFPVVNTILTTVTLVVLLINARKSK